MAKSLLERVTKLESVVQAKANVGNKTVFGIFRPEQDDPESLPRAVHIRSIKRVNGEWVETDEPYSATLSEKMERVLRTDKRFVVVIGGRGSGKSQGEAQIVAVDMHDNGVKTACFREFQNSIDDSVYSLIKDQVNVLGLDGFDYTNNSIKHLSGTEAKFRGIARNPDSIKSMNGFKRFWVEEAQASSENSLKLLTPTMREEGGQIVFTANPTSSEDAFSKKFITRFKEDLDRDGIYEDDLHFVIKVNWRDNPWFPEALNQERLDDKKYLPRAMYDHIWEGEFNDSIENSLIMAEWFDACIDAHKRLGFKPRGVKKVTHDPADLGKDPAAIAYRHGNVFLAVEEKEEGDVNESCDWAIDWAINRSVDQFEYDVGGMGHGLKRQVTNAFEGSNVSVYMFGGGSKVDSPDAIYQPAQGMNIKQQKRNKEVFRNLRAQCYSSLRDRVYKTYLAVERGIMCDPEELVSFSSDIKHLSKLRSELCRMPVKPNGSGLFELYTKDVMKRQFNLSSPNLADCVMMSERKHETVTSTVDIEFDSLW